jgi:hypothetical protein
MMIFSVRQFGAIGDGVTDDTRAIRMAIQAASQRPQTGTDPQDPWGKGGVVYFPPGQYKITDKLIVDRQSGIQLIGAGAFPGDERATANDLGPRASLIWDGDTLGPDDSYMLHFTGCMGITISDLGLYAPEGNPGDFAAMSLIFFDNAGNWGSGVSTFRNLTLVGAEVGIMMGIAQENNAADIVFERIVMVGLERGFVVPHEQGVNYRWNMLYAKDCLTVMHFELGGCVDLDMAEIEHCGAFGDGDTHWVFDFGTGGPNIRCSRLTCVRFTGGSKCFLRVDGDHRVAIDSFLEAQEALADGTPMVQLTGGAATFHASSFQTKESVYWSASGSRRSTLRYRDCYFNEVDDTSAFPVGNWINSPTQTDCFYSFERCDRVDNIPFPDVRTAW